MIAILTGLILLAGPFATLGVWLWLRSRRAPVRLAEPLDIGHVMGNVFGVFRRENWSIFGLALVLLGVPALIWQLAFQASMQSRMLAQNHLLTQPGVPPALRPNPFAVFANSFSAGMVVVFVANFLLATVFYVVATQLLVGHYERRPVAIVDALKVSPILALQALVVAVFAYFGIVLGMMVFMLPGIVLALSWFVIIPVLVIERTGMIRCFGRSRVLSIGSRGRIFVVGLLLVVLGFVMAALSGATGQMFGSGVGQTPGAIAITLRVLANTIGGALYAAFPAALYVELRRIREGMAMPDLAEVFA